MEKRRIMPITIVITALVLFFAAFILRDNFSEPERIVLPPEQTAQDHEGTEQGEESLRRVSVRPDTVQTAVATLSRAQNYSRLVSVERFWNGGSGVTLTTVRAADGWLRTDSVLSGGTIRRVISGAGESYVWYDNERSYYSSADVVGADAEQGILTYEEVLELPTERICAADYREHDGFYCIYVETLQDEAGYCERYWVDVASGLLVAAEMDHGGELVYRMSSSLLNLEANITDAFELPDGTVLHEISSGT